MISYELKTVNSGDNKLKYFSLSILFLILSQIVAQAFRLIAKVIIARYATPDIYGVFSVIWNEMTLVSLIALIGLGQQLTINLPRMNNNEKNYTFHSSVIYSLLVCVVIGTLALIFNLIKLKSTYTFSLIISIFYVLFLLNQFILIGLKDFFGVFLLNLIQNLTLLILIVLIRNQLSIVNLVYTTAGSIALASISLLIYTFIRYKFSFKEITIKDLKIFSFSKKRLYLFSVDIVESLILYLLFKLPQIFLGDIYAGYVSIVFSIMSIVIILPQIITISMGPLISEEFIDEKYEKMHNSFSTSMTIIYFLQGITIFIFAYFGNPLIKVLYGNEYVVGTFSLFYGFLFAIIVDSISYPIGLYLRNTDHENLFGIGRIISLLLFVLFGPLFLFLMENTMAIPMAYLISKIALLSFYFFSMIKKIDIVNTNDIRKTLLWFAIIFLSFILIIVTNFYIGDLIYRALILISHIGLFILGLSLLKIVNLKQLVKTIFSKITTTFQKTR